MKTLSREHYITALGEGEPALRVEAGELFLLHCAGAMDVNYANWKSGSGERDRVANRATGPVHVEGAEPGGAVAVEILSLAPAGTGVVGKPGGYWPMETDGVQVEFKGDLCFPYEPMLGVLGVAPEGEPLECGLTGDCGGNMDVRDVAPGATVFFPVAREGALLAAGDGHARQGDGEIGGQGVEIALDAIFRARPVPKRLTDRPYLARNGRLMTVGWGMSTDEAIQMAVDDMVKVLAGHGGFEPYEALKLIGIGGEVRLGQVVCPTKTARAIVPLHVFKDRLPLWG